MPSMITRVLAPFGYEAAKIRDCQGRTVGLRVARLDADQRVAGYVAERNGTTFFIADDADVIQKEHAAGRYYEPEELEIIRRAYKGGLFVDAGANVGNHSIFAAKELGARVIAFEPVPASATILKLNVALNELTDRVVIHSVGLSDEDGTASPVGSLHNLGGTYMVEGGNLIIRRGDDMLKDQPVTFIKLDVEGMEIKALKGLSGTIQRCRPTLFVEVATENAADFIEFANANGYHIADEFARYKTSVNYLAVPGH